MTQLCLACWEYLKPKRLDKNCSILTEKAHIALVNNPRSINWKVSFVNLWAVDDNWMLFKELV